MSEDDLARKRELLVATACLQRTKLRIEWLVLRERGSGIARQGPLIAGAVVAVVVAVRLLLRPRAAAPARGSVIVPLLRLLTQLVALARLWRGGSGR